MLNVSGKISSSMFNLPFEALNSHDMPPLNKLWQLKNCSKYSYMFVMFETEQDNNIFD